MRYFISGVAGFIGTNLAIRLLDEGHEVVGIDNCSSGRIGNVDKIHDFFRDFTFIQGDICDDDRTR